METRAPEHSIRENHICSCWQWRRWYSLSPGWRGCSGSAECGAAWPGGMRRDEKGPSLAGRPAHSIAHNAASLGALYIIRASAGFEPGPSCAPDKLPVTYHRDQLGYARQRLLCTAPGDQSRRGLSFACGVRKCRIVR